jgi:hypothetical protein
MTGSADLSQHQDLHITLTVLIGVALSCGALYWSDKTAAPAPTASTMRPPSKSTPAPTIALPNAPPAILRSIVPESDPAGDGRTAANPRPPEIPPSNYDGPELPIVFAFSERATYTAEENDEGKLVNVSKQIKEGIISNSSDKPLAITATEVNIATQETSQAQFVVSAGAQKHFGSDQGLKMISGDQMTLRSPAYKDFVQQIP